MTRLAARALSLLALALPLHAGESFPIDSLLLAGDEVDGLEIHDVRRVLVNDRGDWLAIVNWIPTEGHAEAVVVNGEVLWRTGSEHPSLAGPVAGIREADLNDFGQTAVSLYVEEPEYAAHLFLDDVLLMSDGDEVTLPELPGGLIWLNPYGILNDAGQILINAVARSHEQILSTLVLWDVDPVSGLQASHVVRLDGDQLAGIGHSEVVYVYAGPEHLALNDQGQVLHAVILDLPPTGGGRRAVILDDEVIAMDFAKGQPTSPGKYTALQDSRLALNDHGAAAMLARIHVPAPALTEWVIERDTGPFAQTDQVHPALGALVQDFGDVNDLANIDLGNDGDLLWFAAFGDEPPFQRAFVFEDRPVVLEGVSQARVDGAPITIAELGDTHRSSELSDSGQYAAFLGTLADGRQGAFRVQLSPGLVPMVACGETPASLRHASGLVLGGHTVRLLLEDEPSSPAAGTFLVVSSAPAPTWPPCGTAVPGGGEVLVGLAPPNPLVTLAGGPSFGHPVEFELAIPQAFAPFALPTFVQALVVAPENPSEPYRLSNGLAVELPE